MLLLDTNILIDVLRGQEPALRWLEQQPQSAISVITWIEVLVGSRDGEAERLEPWLESFPRIALDQAIARETVQIRQRHGLKVSRRDHPGDGHLPWPNPCHPQQPRFSLEPRRCGAPLQPLTSSPRIWALPSPRPRVTNDTIDRLRDQAPSQRVCRVQGLPSSSQNDPSTRRRC